MTRQLGYDNADVERVVISVETASAPTLFSRSLEVALLTLLALVIPALLLGLGSGALSTILVLPYLVTIASSSVLTTIIVGGERAPMRLTFHIYCYLFMGLSPLVQISNASFPQRFPVDLSDVLITCLVVLLGIATWEFVYFWVGKSKRPPRLCAIDTRRLNLLLAVSVVTAIYYLIAAGSAVFESREARGDSLQQSLGSNTAGSAFVVAVGTVPSLVVLVSLLHSNRKSFRSRLTIGFIALVVLIVSNPISSPRLWIGTVGLSVFMVIGGYTARSQMRAVAIAFLVGFLVIFPIADAFRYNNPYGQGELPSISEQLQTVDYDSFQQAVAGISMARDQGVGYGQQLLGTLTFFVPRELWKTKPLNTGEKIAYYTNNSNTNLSAPLWAEGYVDLGPLGTVLLLGTFGAAASFVDRRFQYGNQGGAGLYAVIAPILAFYQVILLRGPLLGGMSRLAVLIACFVFVAKWEKVQRS